MRKPNKRQERSEEMNRAGGTKTTLIRNLDLGIWEEALGKVSRVSLVDNGVEIILHGVGIVKATGLAGGVVAEIVAIPPGTQISILRTDLELRPYAFRVFRLLGANGKDGWGTG